MPEYQPPVPEELHDRDILDALSDLPSRPSEVVHEFHYREIQDTLHIPMGTVMSRLSRGRQKLRDKPEAIACAGIMRRF
jgi:DNA-directed RNA polymerase specialized sigma24 family protein